MSAGKSVKADQLFTTAEVAMQLGKSYDDTRKRLRSMKPVQVIGKNKMWTYEQIESMR